MISQEPLGLFLDECQTYHNSFCKRDRKVFVDNKHNDASRSIVKKNFSMVIFVVDFKGTSSIFVLESEDNNIKPGFLEYQVLW